MSKYFNDDTQASLPGRLALSVAKLRDLEPQLFGDRTFKCGPTCDKDHPGESIRERLGEHLQLGCCGPAVVVSVSPLVVAVYGSDLDASILLRFPQGFVDRYGLALGTRLVAVNSFFEERGEGGRELLYAVDLIPGPNRTNWSTFTPAIAEFLSDEKDLIERRRGEIPADEWTALERTAKLRIEKLGLKTARDGKPSGAGLPVVPDGVPYFQPLSHAGRRPGAAQAAARWKRILTIALWIAVGVGYVIWKALKS